MIEGEGKKKKKRPAICQVQVTEKEPIGKGAKPQDPVQEGSGSGGNLSLFNHQAFRQWNCETDR